MLLLTYRRRGPYRFPEHLETFLEPQPERQIISKTLFRLKNTKIYILVIYKNISFTNTKYNLS
jgi:hypothetical protein